MTSFIKPQDAYVDLIKINKIFDLTQQFSNVREMSNKLTRFPLRLSKEGQIDLEFYRMTVVYYSRKGPNQGCLSSIYTRKYRRNF